MRAQYRTGLNSKHNMDKWGFISKEKVEGIDEWTIAERRHQGYVGIVAEQT